MKISQILGGLPDTNETLFIDEVSYGLDPPRLKRNALLAEGAGNRILQALNGEDLLLASQELRLLRALGTVANRVSPVLDINPHQQGVRISVSTLTDDSNVFNHGLPVLEVDRRILGSDEGYKTNLFLQYKDPQALPREDWPAPSVPRVDFVQWEPDQPYELLGSRNSGSGLANAPFSVHEPLVSAVEAISARYIDLATQGKLKIASQPY